jgi:hypothetical protein
MTSVMTEISIGELIDKITILIIKMARLDDPEQLANVEAELIALRRARDEHVTPSNDLDDLTAELAVVNEELWDIENRVRSYERQNVFDDRFINQVRSIYRENDKRSAIKRRINVLTGSRLVEEKSYTKY